MSFRRPTKGKGLIDYVSLVQLDPHLLKDVNLDEEVDVVLPSRIAYRLPLTEKDSLSNYIPFVYPAGLTLFQFKPSSYKANPKPKPTSIATRSSVASDSIEPDCNANGPLPFYHSFVLTDAEGTRFYGFCYTKYHRWDEEPNPVVKEKLRTVYAKVNTKNLEKRGSDLSQIQLFVPQTIFVVSYFPIFNFFKKILTAHPKLTEPLYYDETTVKSIYDHLSTIPMDETPLIPKPKSTTNTEDDDYDDFPFCDVDFSYLFSYLDPSNIVQVFQAILTERKVIFISKLEHLVPSIEALLALLYPFSWPYVYIPLLPIGLLDFLETPLPFLIGLCKESLGKVPVTQLEPTEDVVLVDLEANIVLQKVPLSFSNDLRDAFYTIFNKFAVACVYPDLAGEITSVTEKQSRSLLSEYDYGSDDDEENSEEISTRTSSDKEFKLVYSEDMGWHLVEDVNDNENAVKSKEKLRILSPAVALRSAVISLFVSMFKNYRTYVQIPPDKDINNDIVSINNFFDRKSFVDEMDDTLSKFMSQFADGQIFSFFLQERLLSQEDDVFDRRVQAYLNIQKKRDLKYKSKTKSGELACRIEFNMDEYVLKSWKRRYIKLSGNSVEFFVAMDSKSKTLQKTPLQTILIVPQITKINSVATTNSTDKMHLSYPTMFPFSISSGNQKMILCADSQIERKDWIRCLRARVREWEQTPSRTRRIGKNTVAFQTISKGVWNQSQRVIRKTINKLIDNVNIKSPSKNNEAVVNSLTKAKLTLSHTQLPTMKSTTPPNSQPAPTAEKPPESPKPSGEIEKLRKLSNAVASEISTRIDTIYAPKIVQMCMEDAIYVAKIIRVLQQLLEAPKDQTEPGDVSEIVAKRPEQFLVAKDKDNKPVNPRLVQLKEVIACLFEDVKKAVKVMLDELYTLNESSTTDAIKIAKKLRSVSRVLDHIKPDVAKDEPVQNVPRKATEAPKVELPKVFFDSRIPDRVVGHLRQLLQDLEKYNESKDVVFLAQLARNLRTILTKGDEIRNVSSIDFVVKPSRPLACPETKLIALKASAKTALDDVTKRMDMIVKDYSDGSLVQEKKTNIEQFFIIVDEVLRESKMN